MLNAGANFSNAYAAHLCSLISSPITQFLYSGDLLYSWSVTWENETDGEFMDLTSASWPSQPLSIAACSTSVSSPSASRTWRWSRSVQKTILQHIFLSPEWSWLSSICVWELWRFRINHLRCWVRRIRTALFWDRRIIWALLIVQGFSGNRAYYNRLSSQFQFIRVPAPGSIELLGTWTISKLNLTQVWTHHHFPFDLQVRFHHSQRKEVLWLLGFSMAGQASPHLW